MENVTEETVSVSLLKKAKKIKETGLKPGTFDAYELKLVITGSMLGSQPAKDSKAAGYMASKLGKDIDISDEVTPNEESPEVDENGNPIEPVSKGVTYFHRNTEEVICMCNYQVKGMLKASAVSLTGESTTKQLKSNIANNVYIFPRLIPLSAVDTADEGKVAERPLVASDLKILHRPLRAETAQGPRTAIAMSEQTPDIVVANVKVLVKYTDKSKVSESLLRQILDFGSNIGLGQWRNSGKYGQFKYKLTKIENPTIETVEGPLNPTVAALLS